MSNDLVGPIAVAGFLGTAMCLVLRIRLVRILAVALWAVADAMEAFKTRYLESYRFGKSCIQNKTGAMGIKKAAIEPEGIDPYSPLTQHETQDFERYIREMKIDRL